MAHLYIMARSDAPGMVKIGSSCNPERRRRELQECHTFTMELLAVFPRMGYLEHKVHRRLSQLRVWSGTGREFYSLSPTDAFVAVNDILFAAEQASPRAPSIMPARIPAMTPVIAPSWMDELKFDPVRSHFGSQ